jgi:hypothetical protein
MSFYFRYSSPRFGTSLLHEFYFSSRLLRYKTYWSVFGCVFVLHIFLPLLLLPPVSWNEEFQVYIIYLVSVHWSLELFVDNLFEVRTTLLMGSKEKMMQEDIPHAYNWAYQVSLWMRHKVASWVILFSRLTIAIF